MFSELTVGSFCVIFSRDLIYCYERSHRAICCKNKSFNVITTLQLFTFPHPSPGISMNLKRRWNLSGGSNDFKVWLKDSIFCSAINLVRPHFDCGDCARLGWQTQVNLCHPAGRYMISMILLQTQKLSPPPTHTTHTPINPICLCFYGMKGKGGEWCQKNETALILWAQLCMQVTAGKSVSLAFISHSRLSYSR